MIREYAKGEHPSFIGIRIVVTNATEKGEPIQEYFSLKGLTKAEANKKRKEAHERYKQLLERKKELDKKKIFNVYCDNSIAPALRVTIKKTTKNGKCYLTPMYLIKMQVEGKPVSRKFAFSKSSKVSESEARTAALKEYCLLKGIEDKTQIIKLTKLAEAFVKNKLKESLSSQLATLDAPNDVKDAFKQRIQDFKTGSL